MEVFADSHNYLLLKRFPLPIVALDPNMKVKLWNVPAEDVFGWKEEEIIDREFPIIPSFEQEAFQTMFFNILKGVSIKSIQGKRKRKDGSLIEATIFPMPCYDKLQRISGYMAIITDITEYKENELELEKTFKKLSDFQYALDASATVSITDCEGNIVYVNDHFCEVSKYSREELIGQPHNIVNSGYHSAAYFKKLWEDINQGNVWNGEIRNRTKDGEVWWSNATIVPFLDSDNRPYQFIAIRSDITDRKLMEIELQRQKQEIERFAYFDYLTGLPNRRLFEKELLRKVVQAKELQRMVALLFLDLDGFKSINDTLGHQIGDRLLEDVAKRLNQNRKMDDFVSRIGGDEFTIILSNIVEIDDVHKTAEQLLELFDWPFFIDGYELYVTTSIGISVYSNGSESSSGDLIKNADLAMYSAKEQGKNTYEIFSPTMDVDSYKRFTLQNDLRKAVQENEIFLLFQPKVDSKSNRIVGAEALARWKHRDWGVIPPGEFIVLAEESGFINAIGEQVLLLACSQNKQWQDAGYEPFKISVNFSAIQFLQADVVDMVQRILTKTGLEPRWLEIEITETVVMKNETGTMMKIEQLREMGVSIAIDDFGTGFSSLSYLKKIKPNTVKIDKSFVDEIPADFANTEIATAIIKLAERLNINVVAEGVEYVEQYAYLQRMQCKELQGYLFSRPVPSEEFEDLLRAGICGPQISNEIGPPTSKGRRSYYRIQLPRPLIGEMTITSIAGKEVQLGMTEVLIEDISPGGIRFSSTIKLPTKSDFIFKIRTTIAEKIIQMTGLIVWGKEVDGINQYGFQFNEDNDELSSLLSQFQERLSKGNVRSTHWLETSNKEQFFKQKQN